MKQKLRITSLLMALLSLSCWNGKNEDIEKENKVLKTEYSFEKIIDKIKERRTPLIDSTNFDNFKSSDFLNSEQLNILQVKRMYPKIDDNIEFNSTNKDRKVPYTNHSTTDDFKVTPSYKLNISDKFTTIVLTTFKGEHEIESSIINYDLNGILIDFKVISYDEIAEGAFSIITKIEQTKLTISKIVWFNERVEDIEEYTIEQNGKITPIVKKAVYN